MSDECNLDVVRLRHEPGADFGLCVCQGPDYLGGVYVFLRELFIGYHFSMVVWGIVMSVMEREQKAYIYFDFWAQILLFASSEMGIYGPARSFHCSRGTYYDGYWDYLPWTCRAYWALFSAALPSTVLSCIVFWTQVYNKDASVRQLVLASASPFFAILEFVFIAFPLRLLHFFYFFVFYVAYILFTFIYFKCGGTGVQDSDSIYKELDWSQPDRAVLVAFVGLAIGSGVYFLFCFLSMIKLACRDRIQSD